VERLELHAGGLTFDALAAGPADGPLVLLLHGFPQSSLEWAGVLPLLADAGLRAVAPDQRGYSPGARPADVAAYAMRELVGDALGLADALGAERVHLVGHDWGAAVAWQTAARHPERVRSLTAVSVPHPLALSHAMRTDADQQQRSAYIGVFRRDEGIAEEKLAADDWAALRRIYEGRVPDEHVVRYVELLSAPGALTAALNWYRAASVADVTEVGPVRVPTLYVWSTEDRALGPVAAQATAGHVEGPYRFEVLEGLTHWVPDEAPHELAGLVLEHVRAA
jgi:pimeloyl-ACP methyl ester carboxylesterase